MFHEVENSNCQVPANWCQKKMTDSSERQKLESKLHELGVAVLSTLHDNAAVLANPVEIYRCYLTNILTPIIPEVNPLIIYEAIQWTNSLTHGDLVREPQLLNVSLQAKSWRPMSRDQQLLQQKPFP
jgi:hypothetical protein